MSGEGVNRIAATTLSGFLGDSLVSEAFSIDGRGEDYDHVFEWDPEGEAIWTSPDGAYSVAALPDFEPDAVVLRHGGRTVGWYLDGGLWIDEAHRGKGLAPEMILAAAERFGTTGRTATSMGFSPAGYAAHVRAHALAVERAGRAENDPDDVPGMRP